jgi:hypothetical protein
MDYNSLIDQIKSYANREDAFFVNQIPNFINQAINRIYSEAETIGFQQITVVSPGNQFVAGTAIVNKPVNWKETVSFQYITTGANPTTTFLLPKTYEFCKSYWPDQTVRGAPLFYADLSYNQFFIAPTPDADYPYQLIFLGLPLFDINNPRNFLTQIYPNLLLYSCMMEVTVYLKDDERLRTWTALYKEALANVLRDTKGRHTDRLSSRSQT